MIAKLYIEYDEGEMTIHGTVNGITAHKKQHIGTIDIMSLRSSGRRNSAKSVAIRSDNLFTCSSWSKSP